MNSSQSVLLLVLVALWPSAEAQTTCSQPGTACVLGICGGANQTCVSAKCCPNEFVVVPTTTPVPVKHCGVDSTGACVLTLCGVGSTCITGNVCCPSASIVDGPAPPTTTTLIALSTDPGCVDTSPQCAELAGHCGEKEFLTVWGDRCRKTCNRCAVSCVDVDVNCLNMTKYCGLPAYKKSLTVRCPVTCNLCGFL